VTDTGSLRGAQLFEMSGRKQALAWALAVTASVVVLHQGPFMPNVDPSGSSGTNAGATGESGGSDDEEAGDGEEGGSDNDDAPKKIADPVLKCDEWLKSRDVTAKLEKDIGVAARTIVSSKQSTGITVAITCGDKLLASVEAGTADGKEKVSAEKTKYDLSSVGKPITALGVLKLVDKGTITLDTKIGKYLDEYTKGDKANVTFGDVLRQLSGLGYYESYDKDLKATPAKTTKTLRDEPLVAEPRTRELYSNTGYNIVRDAATKAAGEPLEDLITREILKPLGVDEGIGISGEVKNCAATSLDADPSTTLRCESQDRLYIARGVPGHTGWFATAAALSKVNAMIAQDGVYDGKQIFKKATLKAMKEPLEGFTRGAGLQSNAKSKNTGLRPFGTAFSPKAYGHTGWNGPVIAVDPSGLTITKLTNETFRKEVDQTQTHATNRKLCDIAMGIVKP
jgi:CubicO group peptidase (beta-lactamase class C family)